jgi:Cu2+-exporting ATPase
MMTLISLAITTAYFYSLVTVLGYGSTDFFWELATLITIMLLGHWMEMRSIQSAQGTLNELAKLLPDTVELVDGRTLPLSELKIGDVFVVKPGGKIATDGLVIQGGSEVNESMLTGESLPITKTEGSMVIGGTINGSGSLQIKVEKIGTGTLLSGIMKLVLEAQASKSRVQVLADRAAFYLTFIALGAGILTLFVWLQVGESTAYAIERTVTVLVIACPHALGLAIPLVTAISTSLAARNGILVRDRKALEEARLADVVLFDKTGTLTKGELGVKNIFPINTDEQTLVRFAAAVETFSEHPIARAVLAYAKRLNIEIPQGVNFSSFAGRGVQVEVEGKNIYVGGPNLLKELSVMIPDNLSHLTKDSILRGESILYVVANNVVIGALTVADELREESVDAIKSLRQMGVRVAMVTGDAKQVAESVADQLGITEIYAEVLPQGKTNIVKQLQNDGVRVVMVGDGVNDAPALVQANVGIAIGTGTDVAIESAGILLAGNDPRSIVRIITLSRATYSKMMQNLLWATGYNVIAIPLAAGVLSSWGIILSPAVGAILMSLSTIIVALNAQTLRKLKLYATL